MKKSFYLLLAAMLFSIAAIAQCTTNVDCTGTQFEFTFSTLPNSGNVDVVQVHVGSSTVDLTVDSIVGTTIYTNMNGLSCSDVATFIKYYYNGSKVGNNCTVNTQLPVELTDFSVTRFDESILLSWVTASEVNNSHFEVQKSYDGLNWETLGTVDGAGTTNDVSTYTFLDRETKHTYYRLNQVDFNNTNEVSAVIQVSALVVPAPVRVSIIRADGSTTTIDDPQALIVTEYNDGTVVKQRIITQ